MTNKARQKQLTDQMAGALKHTQGTMPVTVVVNDREEADFCNEFKIGKKHTKLVDVRVGK